MSGPAQAGVRDVAGLEDQLGVPQEMLATIIDDPAFQTLERRAVREHPLVVGEAHRSEPEAEAELETFFQESFKKGLRCVKVIHGRGLRSTGGARIKNAVVRRLSGHFRKDIIAYVSARQCDGGLGALYILLKRK